MNRMGGPPATGPPSAAGAGSSYFQPDNKKGEVNELKTLLRNVSVERDPKRKRDVIKKVIAYMTLGIDVSRLFTEMVRGAAQKNSGAMFVPRSSSVRRARVRSARSFL